MEPFLFENVAKYKTAFYIVLQHLKLKKCIKNLSEVAVGGGGLKTSDKV